MDDVYQDVYSSEAERDRVIFFPPALRRTVSAVVFLSLVGGLGLWSYRLGSRDAHDVPVIRAMSGPARIVPEDPGGMTAAHQGQELNSVLEGDSAPTPPEIEKAVPVPVALTAEDGPQGDLLMAAPAQLVADVLAEAAAMGETGGPVDPEALEADDTRPVDATGAFDVASLSEEPGAMTGFRPLSRPSGLKGGAGRTSSGSVAAREVSSVTSGTRLVQLGAFDSEAIARETWSALVAKNGDLLGDKSLYVERTTNNARVFYRLRVAGFGNSGETRDMCQALRARRIDCIPVTLQ